MDVSAGIEWQFAGPDQPLGNRVCTTNAAAAVVVEPLNTSGRNESRTGTIDWQMKIARLRALGHTRALGMEYRPLHPGGESRAARGL